MRAEETTLSRRLAWPFRLGTTSYIIPDEILPNVEMLAGKVDDIELILFESDEYSNLPDQATIHRLAELATKHDLSYTIHLPLDARLGSRDESVRQESVAKCARVISLTQPLIPFAYVTHFQGDHTGHHDQLPSQDIPAWLAAHAASMQQLLQLASSQQFCIETLSYPFELIEEVVEELDLAVCLDIGHILLHNLPLSDYLAKHIARTRVLHLHGIIDNKDHCSIKALPNETLQTILSALATPPHVDRVLTIEVFNQADLDSSLIHLRDNRCPEYSRPR